MLKIGAGGKMLFARFFGFLGRVEEITIMKIIMLGAPGAGKGTQAKKIAAKYGIPHISTGDMFRANIKEGTELGKKAQEYMNAGKLVPDQLVIDLLKERIAKRDCKSGFILDGFPRTIPQAEALVNAGIEIDCVISIEIDDAVIEQRMTGRRVCGSCGSSYHVTANPPKIEGICNACGSELVTRPDDVPETVRSRLAVYHKETEALKGFYEKLGKLRLIEGNQPIEDATRDILAALGVSK